MSGFNRQKLNQDNELAQQMKQLLDLLLNDESLVKVPDEEAMEISLGDSSLDPTLRDGYKEIGLTELWSGRFLLVLKSVTLVSRLVMTVF